MKFLSLDCIKKTFLAYPVSILILFMWTCFTTLSKDGVFPESWNDEFPKILSVFFLLVPLVVSLEVRSFQNFQISNSYFGRSTKDFSIAVLFGAVLFYGFFMINLCLGRFFYGYYVLYPLFF